MGRIKEVIGILNKGADILDQAVTDKDKLNELNHTLETVRAQLLLSGKGQSVTKITICGLVAMVVGTLTWTFLFHPENMEMAINYSLAVTPIITVLTGAYGAGATLKSKWGK